MIGSFSQGGKTVTKLITDSVKARARDHFGCGTLNGAEIEDQGGSGTAGDVNERVYDGWVNGWMDGWMHACMHGWMDAWIDGWMDEPRSVLCPVFDRTALV